jgi:hypothetical protein
MRGRIVDLFFPGLPPLRNVYDGNRWALGRNHVVVLGRGEDGSRDYGTNWTGKFGVSEDELSLKEA